MKITIDFIEDKRYVHRRITPKKTGAGENLTSGQRRGGALLKKQTVIQ